jgi:hypothetical protein
MRTLREVWSDWRRYRTLRLEGTQDSATARLKALIPPGTAWKNGKLEPLENFLPDLMARQQAGEKLAKEYAPEAAPTKQTRKKKRRYTRATALGRGLAIIRKQAGL